MQRPWAGWAACLLAVAFASGCEPGGSGPGDGDADSDVDADGDADGDAAEDGDAEETIDQYLERNGIARLELLEDDTEIGRGVTDADGEVRFYSAIHEIVFDLSYADEEAAPAPGLEVMVSVGPDQAVYFASDPGGELAPLFYVTGIPTADAELAVDTFEVYSEGAGLLEFDPDDPSPFGEACTLIGLAGTFSIGNVVRAMGATVALNVLKVLVEDTCRYFAPVHEELCGIVANVAYGAGSLAVGALNLAGATLFDQLFDVAGELLGDYVCDPVGGYLAGYVVGANDTTARDRYREIARKYNYMLFRFEADPPADAAAARRTLEQLGVELAQVGRVVRNRYFELYNPGAESALPGLALGTVVDLTAAGVELDATFRELLWARYTWAEGYEAILRIRPGELTYEVTEWTYEAVEWETVEWTEDWSRIVGPLADCALAFVTGVHGRVEQAGAYRDADLDTATLVGHVLDVWDARMDYVYDTLWGGTIPDTCTPDEWEPNETWESAVARPMPAILDSSVAEIHALNLCDYLGTGIVENDWYAYNIGPIELNVGARLMPVPAEHGGTDVGLDERLCLEIYFYSELYEIGMMPPDLVAGPACGRVRDWPTIPYFGIRRTMGESWSMLLPRVYAEGAPTVREIDYSLRFTP